MLVAKAGYPAAANKATWNTLDSLLNQNRGCHTVRHTAQKKNRETSWQTVPTLSCRMSFYSFCWLLPQLHTAGCLHRCRERSCCLTLPPTYQVPPWVRQDPSLLSALYGCPCKRQRKNWGTVLAVSERSYFCFFLLSTPAMAYNSFVLLRITPFALSVHFLSAYT